MLRERQLAASKWAHAQPRSLKKAWHRHYAIVYRYEGDFPRRTQVGTQQINARYTCSAYCTALEIIQTIRPSSLSWEELLTEELGQTVTCKNGYVYKVSRVHRIEVVKPANVKREVSCRSCGKPMTVKVAGAVVPRSQDFDPDTAAKAILDEMEIERLSGEKVIDTLATLYEAGVSTSDVGATLVKLVEMSKGTDR